MYGITQLLRLDLRDKEKKAARLAINAEEGQAPASDRDSTASREG